MVPLDPGRGTIQPNHPSPQTYTFITKLYVPPFDGLKLNVLLSPHAFGTYTRRRYPPFRENIRRSWRKLVPELRRCLTKVNYNWMCQTISTACLEEHLWTFNVILVKDHRRWTSRCGSSSLIFRKHSTVSIGNRFGKRWVFMAYHNTWLGSSKVYIINSVRFLLDPWRTTSSSTWQLACDKGVFSAHVFSPSPGMGTVQMAGAMPWCWLRLPRRRGFFTECARCWWNFICAKSYEETGQVVEMLVDALWHVGPAPKARKTTTKKKNQQAG